MNTFSSPENIENEANKLGIYMYPAFGKNTRSLLLTQSQKENLKFQNIDLWEKSLETLQQTADKDWEELMSHTSHHVMKILIAIMNNVELGNGLILIPGIDTSSWSSWDDNWLLRSTPTQKVDQHIPLISNLPLHTDSLSSKFHDDFNDPIVWTLLHGIKNNPTSYFYLWKLMPEWQDNSIQAIRIAEILWYDALKLRKLSHSIQEEIEAIMRPYDFPKIDFQRVSPYAWFTLQSGITYLDSSTWKIIQNPIAHTWYLPKQWDPTWYLRLIRQRDIEALG